MNTTVIDVEHRMFRAWRNSSDGVLTRSSVHHDMYLEAVYGPRLHGGKR